MRPVKTGPLHGPAGAPGQGEEEAALASREGPDGGGQLPSCGGEARSLGTAEQRAAARLGHRPPPSSIFPGALVGTCSSKLS